MNSSFQTNICRISLVLLILLPLYTKAQNGVWGSAGKAKQNVGKKAANTKKKVKGIKDHLQNWGLDTSYNRAFMIGGKLNSDGWSGTVNFVKRRSYKISNFWQISFSEIKHEKQVKQKGTNAGFTALGNPSPYVFGKINNLYTLQVGWGKEHLLLPAVLDDNLSVSIRYNGGLSLAMLKPYYLKLIYADYSTTPETAHMEQHKYLRTDSAIFLNEKMILGSSKWEKGLNEIDYIPGVYFETALVITPGKTKYFAQVITLGINGAFYYKRLPIMQGQVAYPYQVCLFAGLMIGKRWK